MSVRKVSVECGRIDVALRELRGPVFCGQEDVDPLVNCIVGDEVVDEAVARLGDAMDPVLRLQVVV